MNKTTGKIKHQEGTLETFDGVKLFEQWWAPDGEPKAIVAMIHGYAEHSARYTHVGEHLARHGFGVRIFDLRGHGKSPGKRAYIRFFNQYVKDAEVFLSFARKWYPGKPVFIFGHSMGGAITALLLINGQPDLNGALLSGAALKISDDISPFLQRISGFIGKVLPWLPTIKLDSNFISRDPKVVDAYDNDPLVFRKATLAGTGAAIILATKQIQAKMESIILPLLIMHGADDRIIDPEGSKQLYQRAGSSDKTLKLYPNFYHEILNDPDKNQVLDDMVQWMDKHL